MSVPPGVDDGASPARGDVAADGAVIAIAVVVAALCLKAIAAAVAFIEEEKTVDEKRDHIMQFFAYAHLPPAMQAVSKPFGELAEQLVDTLPRNPERTVALRKLLEAKDAAVRAFIAKEG